MKKVNLAGMKFGRLTALDPAGSVNRKRMWTCLCECGEVAFVFRGDLQSGRVKSCGCLQRENAGNLKLSHGHNRTGSRTTTHIRWAGMIQRCCDPNSVSYPNYGGRGIKVCERWRSSFSNFLADMGLAPEEKFLDRINNDGNYEPGNCRWVSRSQNARNCRRNRIVTLGGESKPLVEWSESVGISHGAMQYRLKRQWSAENILRPRSR